MSNGGPNEPSPDDAMRNLASHVSDEEMAEVLEEVAPHMTPEERAGYLKKWGKGGKSK